MPLRFRSVMSYTLPGVLALIGWWWYISRKKERLISHDSPEGPLTAMGLRTSSTEGSNGLVEKGTMPTTNDTESPAPRLPKVSNQRTEQGNISQTHVQDTKATPSLEQRSEEGAPHLGRIRLEKVYKPSDSTLPTCDKDGSPPVSLKGHKEPERSSSPDLVTELEKRLDKKSAAAPEVTIEELILPCQSTKITSSSPTTAYLSDAERPEPEGEVAKHHSTINTQNEMVVCALTPARVQSVIPSEAESPETPPSAQDLHQHIATSTPTAIALTSTALTTIQDSTITSVTSQDILAHNNTEEEQDLELLAAGLITDVISAAAQEVLGVTRCQITNNSQPSCNSSMLLTGSSDGIISEDHHNSMFDNQVDEIQVTDLSAREATQPQSLVENITEVTVLGETEDHTVATVCEIKRLNGMGLRNGAHGTCEVETDQSGGSDVNSMDSVDSGCTMGAGENQSNHTASSSSELIIWEVEVPKHLVGRLIGKQGRYVSFLKQNSGAKIYISTLPYTQEFQICHIEGTQQQVDKALSLIGKKFKDLDLTNLYAPPPPPLTLPSLPMTSWLLLPSGVTVEVIVVNIVSAGHIFVQQHTHPTYHALRSLDQQMFLCYSQPGTPALPSPAEVGVICAAPAVEGAWWRAQVITFYKETKEVEIRYVDYGGYDRVKIDSLRQIRSDFVTLPFQGAEVLLDNIAPLPGEDRFSAEATSALEEMTRGVALLAQVSNYDNNTGLPLVHLWNMVGDEWSCDH
uniref:A kinase (PRKA) anchor protein 1b n=1 Tax=Amphiprion percula TaxID=161767 RepID=A0A3P8SBR8_AMPPE